ncbi:MAG: hypothetical protein K6C94_10355, partial [Candidatus Gastranaerophilales bacterium]|nr:hypothetical protein [Candidatus Gastranaerophilales bacterium]
QKAPVYCLDLFAINGVTVLLLASPSASAHRSLHCVAVHFAFCYFGLRSTQKPLFSWGTRSFFFSSKEKKKEWVRKRI